MNTRVPILDESSKRYMKSTIGRIDRWGDQLYVYLKDAGIKRSTCRRIARSRVKYGLDKICSDSYWSFGRILDYEAAFGMYCAYIRHEMTNYDEYCQESIEDYGVRDRPSVRRDWKKNYPDEYDYYQKQCSMVRNKLQNASNIKINVVF